MFLNKILFPYFLTNAAQRVLLVALMPARKAKHHTGKSNPILQ